MPRRRIGFLAAIVVVGASILSPTLAWAKYRTTGVETNVFATYILGTPPTSSCGALGVLSVTLQWTSPADVTKVLSYELGQSPTSGGGGGYTYTDVGNVLTKTVAIGTGNTFFVVRTVNHLWRSGTSPERHVFGVLTLAATCS
jgi:hypothetical protein